LLQRGLIYVAENPELTNADIKAFMYDPLIHNQCMRKTAGTSSDISGENNAELKAYHIPSAKEGP
jgi:hypothetical protein